MFRRWYIEQVDPAAPDLYGLLFGPFKSREIDTRVNDEYADLLAQRGYVSSVKLTRKQAKGYKQLNSRDFWMEQLETVQDV